VAGAAVRVQAHTEGFLETPGRPIPVRVRVADLDGRAVAGAPVVLEPAYDEWNAETHEAVRKPLPDVRGTTDTHGIANVLFVAPRQGFVRLTARAHDGAQREARGIAYLWVVGAGEGSLDARYGALSLHTDKRRYQPGEVARVLVNSDAVGYTVLLTIEGDRIGAAWSVPIRARSTVVMVPVRAEYGPNVILAAASVREKKFASAEAPLRVDVPARALSVVLRADKPRYAPGETATYDVEISDASGRPARAEFSLAVVDESIYALQEDDPNALRDAFYPRRHNRVRTTFSFAVKYLGDADKGAGGIQPRRRFLDTAYWGPVHRTDEAGRARISVRLPDNLTTWRATVIAHALDTAVGRQVHKSLVTKDFFVRVEMPRLLTERDVGRVLAIVHNNTERARLATVRFQASGLTVAGPDTQPVFVEPGASAEAAWPVKASGPGAAKLTVTAWTDGAGADRLTDGVEVPLPIRAYGRDQVLEVAGEAAAARVERKTLMLDASAAPAGAKLTVRVTPSITSGVAGALEYLVDYPYGCVEQTMSRFLPSLLARKLARGGAPLDAAVAARVPAIVADGLARLRRQQHESGAWGWWEHDDDHPWMTAYVLHGLAIAKQEGAPVGDDFLQRAREAAARLQTSNPNERMFLWYGLALAGDTETPRAALAKAPPRWGALGPEGLAYAVLLAKHLGQDAAAPFAELMKRARADADTLSWAPGAGADRWWRWNWSDRSTTAAALRAMIAHDRRDPRAGAVLRWLMRARAGDHWGSTRDTSFVLAALADYLAAAPESARPRGELRIKLNGQLVRTVTLSPEMARGPAVTVDLPTDLLNAGANSLLIERDGEGSVFWTARFRQTIAADELPAVGARGVTVRREYLRAVTRRAGPEAWTLQLESANNEFRQNDRVVVRVTVETSRDLAYILLEDLFPSGFEPNERGSAEIDEWRYWWTSIDVRDDRVAFFARELPAGKHVFEYNLRAQTPGQYQALPAVLSGMYHPEVRAESAGGQVKIR
jgi:uncharacterized protein YfaS (alpha-2-macroglobulin family)